MKPTEAIPLLLAAMERLGLSVAVFGADELSAVQKYGGLEMRPQGDGSIALVVLGEPARSVAYRRNCETR